MGLRETLFAAAGISAAPLLALLLLAICGAAATGPALLAMAGVAAAALGLALLWIGDLARFASALRQAAGDRAHPLAHSAAPRLPLLADLAREAERLLHAEATRAARAQAAQHAEAEILERLPDPLVVLDVDFRVLRGNAAASQEFGSEAAQRYVIPRCAPRLIVSWPKTRSRPSS